MYFVLLTNQIDIYSVVCLVVLSERSLFLFFRTPSKLHKFEVCFGHELVTARLIKLKCIIVEVLTYCLKHQM